MRSKNLVFGTITILLPIAAILLLEVTMRLFGIGSPAYNEFTAIPAKDGYVALNPEYVTRYFPSFQPSVPFNPFSEKKEENTFRVFVLGGSTTAGFPYQFYHGFPRRMEARFELAEPDRRIEVINLGMSAVNSYTIWDLRRAVLSASPDAVIIYAGHNEYYGAFGVASNLTSLYNSVWLKRSVLRLKHSVLYSALERGIARLRGGSTVGDGTRTLMAQVVRKASVKRGDAVFNAGIEQYRKNIGSFIQLMSDNDVHVFIGTLVSNLRDQPPLADNDDAVLAYQAGLDALRDDKPAEARLLFEKAREIDEIRFRAPREINQYIRSLEAHANVSVVDVEQTFADSSRFGIPGADLFVDHLHPNARGYDLMGNRFYDALQKRLFKQAVPDRIRIDWAPDPLDAASADLQIRRLKSGYPFVKDLSGEEELERFNQILERTLRGGDVSDSLAADYVSRQKQMPVALQEAIDVFRSRQDTLRTLRVYRSMMNWQPLNEDFVTGLAGYGLDNPEYDELTSEIAAFSWHRFQDTQSLNALAAIRLRRGHLDDAEHLLGASESINPDDPVMLFNQARLWILRGDTLRAQEYFNRYRRNNEP